MKQDDSHFWISGGLIVDGSGSPGYRGTVEVVGERIKGIHPVETAVIPDAQVIDATGLVVSPGFIDIHAHGDIEPLIAPWSESKLLNGVTLEICGNCGSSPFPLQATLPGYLREKGELLGVSIDWTDVDGYFSRLEENCSAIHRGSFVGHGRLRGCVMGTDARYPSSDEINSMIHLLRLSLEQGAMGLSSGLAYAPGCYASYDELKALCTVVSEYDGLYATHLRSEGDHLFSALAEAIHLAEDTGVRLQLSHLKISGRKNWSQLDLLHRVLHSARSRGVNLTADWYPYEACNANLDSLLPNWVYEGGTFRLLSRLRDPKVRNRLAEHIAELSRSEVAWDQVVVANVTLADNEQFQGRNILEISEVLNLSPEDALFNLILAEGGRAEGFMFSMSKEVQREIIQWPFVAVGSDSTSRSLRGADAACFPHPRTYGCVARFLWRIREEKLLTLEEGIRRLTGLPASILGFSDRGLIQQGAMADLCVFDFSRIVDRATYQEPRLPSGGVEYVFVNGTPVFQEGVISGALPGTVLRSVRSSA